MTLLAGIIGLTLCMPFAAHAQKEAPQEVVEQEAATKPEIAPLTDALAAAYNTNPRLKAQREELKSLDEQVSVAISGFRPTVVGEAERGRERTSVAKRPWDYGNTTSKVLTVDQPIFSGLDTVADFKTARANVRAGRAILLQTEQEVLMDAVSAYTDVAEKQAVLELSRNNVGVLSKQLEASQTRFDAGELTRTDVAQSQARLANSEAILRQAEGNLATARVTFERVIGFTPQLIDMPVICAPLPDTLDEAESKAEAASPLLLSARHSERAADYAVDSRIGAIIPDVSLRGTMSRTEGGGFPGVDRYDSDSVTLNLTVPFYQSGSEYARIRDAKHIRERAKFNTLDTHDAVLENVRRAWEDYQAAKAIIDSTESAVNAANVALEGVRQENEYGVRTILDVLDAEQESFNARVRLVQAKRQMTLSGYGLLAAVGDLTASNLKLPVDIYDATEHYDDVKWLPIGF